MPVREEIKRSNTFDKSKPIVSVNIKGEDGAFVHGTLVWKGKVGQFNRMSYLIKLKDTNGSTTLYNKTTKQEEETEVNAGDTVSLGGTTVLDRLMESIKVGDDVEITSKGKATPRPGKKAAFLFSVVLIKE